MEEEEAKTKNWTSSCDRYVITGGSGVYAISVRILCAIPIMFFPMHTIQGYKPHLRRLTAVHRFLDAIL